MTKTELLRAARSEYAIAVALGISRQAVNRWGDRIPPLRLYQLRDRRPEWFKRRRA